jgi:hypothetical protein
VEEHREQLLAGRQAADTEVAEEGLGGHERSAA